jgi:N-methylhydantoinase B
VDVAVIADRRIAGAPGIEGGSPGSPGRNALITTGADEALPGSFQRRFPAGTRLRIETPGGGGWGAVTGT